VKILHITPHLGGGVGRVILNWVCTDKSNVHTVITLDFANEEAISKCSSESISLFSQQSVSCIKKNVEKSDIVIIHFWNHPLLYDLIMNNSLPPSRLVFWSHISGFHPPYVIPSKILSYPDLFVFSSKISYSVKTVKEFPYKDKLDYVLSTGGIDWINDLKPKQHVGFNVGYIGTVDYSKMHPDFIKMSKLVRIPDIRFTILGGNNEKEIAENAPSNFRFVGKVDDIKPFLAEFDVFGYPLNPNHFGTAEQVIQEAMSVGVVPVVMNNPAECELVSHMDTGLISDSPSEYARNIELLYHDVSLRIRLSENAKKYAQKEFSLVGALNSWKRIYSRISKKEKSIHTFSLSKAKWTPFELFLESIDGYDKPFRDYAYGNDFSSLKEMLTKSEWTSNSKGTPKQYLNFFNDKYLQKISELYI